MIQFDAPLISFGRPAVDQNGVVQRFPALSMLTGLFANALGWDHRDADRLTALQERIRFAARIDRVGDALVDYQTVDLGADWMRPELTGWTTRGRLASRGGASSVGTHIRYRHFRADSVHTVVAALVGDGDPTLPDVAAALREPARPLFIGRKCCLPAAPVLRGLIEAPSLAAALAAVPRGPRTDSGPLSATWWDDDEQTGSTSHGHLTAVTDERNWRSRVHVGRRFMREGTVNPAELAHA